MGNFTSFLRMDAFYGHTEVTSTQASSQQIRPFETGDRHPFKHKLIHAYGENDPEFPVSTTTTGHTESSGNVLFQPTAVLSAQRQLIENILGALFKLTVEVAENAIGTSTMWPSGIRSCARR